MALPFDTKKKLFEVVEKKDINGVLELLSFGTDINVRDKNGFTPLYIAVRNRNLPMVNELLQRGADINSVNSEEICTPLLAAIDLKFDDIVEELLKYNPEINIKNTIGWSALTYAAKSGDMKTVKELVKRGADINDKKYFECSIPLVSSDRYWEDVVPILIAIGRGDLEMLKYFQEQGGIIYNRDFRISALAVAAKHGKIDMYKYIISISDKKDSSKFEADAFKFAILFKEREMAKYIVYSKTEEDVSMRSDELNQTFLEILCDYEEMMYDPHEDYSDGESESRDDESTIDEHIDMIKYLISLKIDMNIGENYWKRNLLHHAVSSKRDLKIIELLIKAGVDVNSKDRDGYTPLHVAAHVRDLKVVKYLIDNGANYNVENDKGHTPLWVAMKYSRKDIVDYLYRLYPGKEESNIKGYLVV